MIKKAHTGTSRAFTLVELVTVVAIISILASITIPRFFSVNSNDEYRFLINNLIASIKYAQKISVGMGCEVQVSHTTTSLTLNLRSNCTTGAFTNAVRDPASGNLGYIQTIPNEYTITSNNFPIYFDSFGRARQSSDNSIRDADLSIAGRTIQIVGETGFTYEI